EAASEANRISFQCDKIGPDVAISTPVAGSYGPVNPLASIAGTADDSPAGVGSIELKIADVTDSTRWNGLSWVDISVDTWVATSYSSGKWSGVSPDWSAADRTNHNFSVQVRAYDNAGNSNTSSIVSFKYDSTAPVAGLIDPNIPFENATLVSITGTASDLDPGNGVTSGLQKISIAILSGGLYFQGPAGTQNYAGTEKWWEVTGSPWNFAGIPAWQDNVSYEVRAKAYDNASNQSPVVSYTFRYDSVLSVSTVTFPSNNRSYNAVSSMYGTASDSISGPKEVDIVMRDLDGFGSNIYWNPVNGQFNRATPAWGVVTGTDSWNIGSSSFTLTSGHRYRVLSRAIDNALNTPADPADWSSFGSYFRYDSERPVSKTTAPVDGGFYRTPITGIYGTANDTLTGNSGVTQVEYRILRSDDKWYNGGTNWNGTENSWDLTTSVDGDPGYWYKELSANPWNDGYKYSIISRAQDNATNAEVSYSTITFTYDTSAPGSEVNLPLNARQYKTMTYIWGASTDTTASAGGWTSGVSQVGLRIKRESDSWYLRADGSGWQNTEPDPLPQASLWSSSWTYTPSDARWTDNSSYTVTAKSYDRAGNSVYGSSAYFIFDSSAPGSVVALPDQDEKVMTVLPTISGTAQDYVAGGLGRIEEVKVRLQRVTLTGSESGDDAWWTGTVWQAGAFNENWWRPTTWTEASATWEFPTAGMDLTYNGGYRIDVRALDRAGNYQVTYSSRSFVFRPPMAQTAVSAPLHGRNYRTLALLNGTANSETASMQISIQRLSDGQFYNASPSSWTTAASGYWLAVSPSSPSWNYSISNELWVHGSSFTVRTRGKNPWGISENSTLVTPPAANAVTFTFDTVEPYSSFVRPENGEYYNALSTLSGAAGDGLAGVKTVGVLIKKGAEYFRVADSSWVLTETWNPASFAAPNWQLVMVSSCVAEAWANGQSYLVKSRAQDDVLPAPGNQEGNGSGNAGVTFTFDVVLPTATVVMPANGGEYRTLATLSGSLTDLAGDRVELYIQDLGGE
ncbi:MAG: Ig-like domain repeat protein, partial [Endomicrobiales bacterium]